MNEKGATLDTAPKKEHNKQAYEKPKLRMIELAADEVMGTACKILGPVGIGSKNNLPCAANQCVSKGS
jgi:hypothetical protein